MNDNAILKRLIKIRERNNDLWMILASLVIKNKATLKNLKKKRIKNNKFWMKLVAAALKTLKGRAVIRQIIKNDRRVSKWMERF